MPVDLGFLHPILEVWRQQQQEGQFKHQSAQQKEEFLKRQELEREKLSQEHDIAQKQIDVNKSSHEAQAKMAQAQHDLLKSQLAAKFQEMTAQTGLTPPGFQRQDTPTYNDISALDESGQAANDQPYNSQYTDPKLGMNFQTPDPTTYATQQAEQARISNAPKTEQIIAEKQAAEAARMAAQLKIDADKKAADLELQREKDKAAEKRNNATIASRTEAAKIKARAAKTPDDKYEAELERPLSLEESKELGVPIFTKRRAVLGTVPGMKPNPTQSTNLGNLDDAEDAIISLQKRLETVDPKTGVEGYKKYFKGPGLAGVASRIVRASSNDIPADVAQLHSDIASVKAKAIKATTGLAMNVHEEKNILNFVPDPSETNKPEEIRAKLNTLLANTRSTRANLLKGIATRIGGSGAGGKSGATTKVWNSKTQEFEDKQ